MKRENGMIKTVLKAGLKKRKIQAVLVIECLLILAGAIGLFGPTAELRVEAGQEGIRLAPGVYNVCVTYAASGDGSSLSVSDMSLYGSSILFNSVHLYSGNNTEECQLWVLRKTDQVRVDISVGENSDLQIYGIKIIGTKQECFIWIFTVLCAAAAVNLLMFLRLYDKVCRIPMQKKIIWGILAMTVVLISVPNLTDYNLWGHDWGFHLLRVEGLVSGWRDGQFPVRIQGNWLKGYGYAASVFYSDLFLAIPAFFRLLGFTVRTANNLFVIVINTATVVIGYLSFKKCFKKEMAAAAGAVLYAMSAYRLYDVYMRSAMGEALAMTFLPLVFCGFYCIFTEDENTEKYGSNWIFLTAGLTGVIHSHVLTCEMLALVILPLCLILWKRALRRKTFTELLKTVVATVIFNLWYLVPFLDFLMFENFNVNHVDAMHFQSIQAWGTMPSHLLFLFYGRGARTIEPSVSMDRTGSFGIGAVLLGVLVAWAYLEFAGKIKKTDSTVKWAGRILFYLSLAFFILSSCYFPWDALQNQGGAIERLVLSLQFPYRFLGLACVTAAALAGVFVKYLADNCSIEIARVTAYAGIFAACIFACYQTNQILMHYGLARVYERQGMGTMEVSNGEYLPYQTDQRLLQADQIVCGAGVTAEGYEKKRDTLQVRLAVTNAGAESYVEVPLLYYRGYAATDTATGEKLAVEPGSNNVVRVLLPERYEGELRVRFREPWYWRMGELISLLAITGTLTVYGIAGKGKRRTHGRID